MFEACVIRGRRFAPARFCAPLAGYTHSAFRRLLAELGGCGAVWTEMLAARQILSENFQASPWVRRRPQEGPLIYQLMVSAGDPLDRILGVLEAQGVEALDLNLACNARSIRAWEAGSALFENRESLERVVGEARRLWPGLLTAKIRLGYQRPGWQERFSERLRLFEETGLDAVILHPRFFEDKFKRRARLELIPWAATLTSLPLIANGDLGDAQQVRAQAAHLQAAGAIMIGRMAIVRPWIFATWDQAQLPDLGMIWRKMSQFLQEDFPAKVALRRLQMFTKFYAANFAFGHQFNVEVSNALSLEEVVSRAEAFFSRSPATVLYPTVAGL
jgi:tRNA-dihydrouridine synthase B